MTKRVQKEEEDSGNEKMATGARGKRRRKGERGQHAWTTEGSIVSIGFAQTPHQETFVPNGEPPRTRRTPGTRAGGGVLGSGAAHRPEDGRLLKPIPPTATQSKRIKMKYLKSGFVTAELIMFGRPEKHGRHEFICERRTFGRAISGGVFVRASAI